MRDHLGDWVAALVDGELDHEARERALAHLSGCAACRAEVSAQRRLKAVLATPTPGQVPASISELVRGLPVPPAPAPWPGRSVLGLQPWPDGGQPLAHDAGCAWLVRPIPHPWRARRILAAATFTAAVGAVAVTGLSGGVGEGHSAPAPASSPTPAVYVVPSNGAGPTPGDAAHPVPRDLVDDVLVSLGR